MKAKEEEIIRISKETLENGAIFSTQKFDLSMYQEQNTTLLQHLGKSQKQVEILQHQISVLKKHFEDTKNKKQKLESCFERLNKQLILRTQQLNDTVKRSANFSIFIDLDILVKRNFRKIFFSKTNACYINTVKLFDKLRLSSVLIKMSVALKH